MEIEKAELIDQGYWSWTESFASFPIDLQLKFDRSDAAVQYSYAKASEYKKIKNQYYYRHQPVTQRL